mgnify:CR=1 FL=1
MEKKAELLYNNRKTDGGRPNEDQRYIRAVNACAGKVELMTAEGDCLNLKSRLCQYIALTQMFEDRRVEGIELVVSEPGDLGKLLPYIDAE